MSIIILVGVVFIISFLLIFKLVYSGNKQEAANEKLGFWNMLFVVTLLALLPTGVIAVMIFVLLGSTNFINIVFALHISTKQVVILVITFFVYLFSLDNLFELILKLIIGKNIFYLFIMILIRILVFYLIALAIGLNDVNSFTIALGVAVIIFLFELIFHLKGKDKHKLNQK